MSAPLAPEKMKDRHDIYRFFDGISSEGKDGIDARRTRIPLVKTFLMEHVSGCGGFSPKPPEKIFNGATGTLLAPIDDSFFSVTAEFNDPDTGKPSRGVVGFIEAYDERFFAYYTCEPSPEAQRRFGRWIQQPDLDATWFSSPLLQELWDSDVSRRGDKRFSKLVFQYESIFEMPSDFAEQSDPYPEEKDETDSGSQPLDGDSPEPERRLARFSMGDSIGIIKASLTKLQGNYAPLHVLHALRLPSLTASGGHDLYQSGQITNRTDSFEDHRNTARYLYGIYKSVLEYTEKRAWQRTGVTEKSALTNIDVGGAPLIVLFDEELRKEVFDRWVSLAFQKRNKFKLWGKPIRLGPTKVHVYGADRHLWQPINLEITSKGLVAMLPRGTCGNTFHRLIANIQQYVSPKIEVWLGAEPINRIVKQWTNNLEAGGEN